MTTRAEPVMRIGQDTGFYESLLRLRDADRARKESALTVVHGDQLPVERSRQGLLKWYLHPLADNTAIKSLGVYVQELPPRSSSGRYRWQGGEAILFLEGAGYTQVDGEQFEWEAWDALIVPVRSDGVTIQHFNPAERPARFVCAWPNLLAALGVDLGAGLEQLADATVPE